MSFFDSDNRFNIWMTRIFDLCLLSILTTVFCIPVFTSGAALTSMYAVMMKMNKNREGSLVSTYIREFKSNFHGSVAGSLILVAGILLITFDLNAWTQNEIEGRSIWYGITLAILLFFLVILDWYLCVRARFVETTVQALSNAARFSLIHLPYSVLMGVYTIFLLWLILRFAFLIFLVPILGFAVVCYPKAFIMGRKLDKYIHDEGLAPLSETGGEASGADCEDGSSEKDEGYDRLTEIKREKKAMKASDKASYIWYNHVGVFVFAALFIIVVGGIGYNLIYNNDKPIFTLAVVNSYSDKTDAQISDDLQKMFEKDETSGRIIVDTGYQLKYTYGDKVIENPASDDSFYEKFFLNIRNHVMDAAIIPESFYDYCNSVEDMFYDMEYILTGEQLEKYSDRLVKGYGDYADFYRGICIDECDFLESEKITFLDVNKNDRYILVFPAGSTGKENCRKYLELIGL